MAGSPAPPPTPELSVRGHQLVLKTACLTGGKDHEGQRTCQGSGELTPRLVATPLTLAPCEPWVAKDIVFPGILPQAFFPGTTENIETTQRGSLELYKHLNSH